MNRKVNDIDWLIKNEIYKKRIRLIACIHEILQRTDNAPGDLLLKPIWFSKPYVI